MALQSVIVSADVKACRRAPSLLRSHRSFTASLMTLKRGGGGALLTETIQIELTLKTGRCAQTCALQRLQQSRTVDPTTSIATEIGGAIFSRGQGVSLQWLPAYAGIARNEAADRLADSAHSLPAFLAYPRNPRVIEGTLRLHLQEGRIGA